MLVRGHELMWQVLVGWHELMRQVLAMSPCGNYHTRIIEKFMVVCVHVLRDGTHMLVGRLEESHAIEVEPWCVGWRM